jgi:hypothetical protein
MFTCWERYSKKKTCIIVDDYNKMNQLEKENNDLKEKVDKFNTTLAKFI